LTFYSQIQHCLHCANGSSICEILWASNKSKNNKFVFCLLLVAENGDLLFIYIVKFIDHHFVNQKDA
ncbi:hypothetical protein CEN47_29380, partial [Fischerella thermalis CCMEE 5319]